MSNALIKYDNDFIPKPFGLYNTGLICYFNSLLQSLMSCSSLNQYLLSKEYLFKSKNNLVALLYIDLLKNNLEKKNDKKIFQSSNILIQLITLYKKKNPNITVIGTGQEDITEFLIFFIDVLSDKYVEKLFIHKYQCDILCIKCKHMENIQNDLSYQFEIPLNINESYELDYLYKNKKDKVIDISNYIRNNVSNLSNRTCKKCNQNNTLVTLNRLKFIPTILVITFLKYNQKKLFNFPKTIEYANDSIKKKYIYILVSSAEQSGNMSGGHYICKSKRQSQKSYVFNDIAFAECEIQPTINSYMIFYHYYDTVDI